MGAKSHTAKWGTSLAVPCGRPVVGGCGWDW